MINRRTFVLAIAAAAVTRPATAQRIPEITVYHNPS